MTRSGEVVKVAHVVTAPVAAGAYPASHDASKRNLWHGLVVNNSGEPVGVLCVDVKLESILDDQTQYDRHGMTCKACIRKFKALPARCSLDAMIGSAQ